MVRTWFLNNRYSYLATHSKNDVRRKDLESPFLQILSICRTTPFYTDLSPMDDLSLLISSTLSTSSSQKYNAYRIKSSTLCTTSSQTDNVDRIKSPTHCITSSQTDNVDRTKSPNLRATSSQTDNVDRTKSPTLCTTSSQTDNVYQFKSAPFFSLSSQTDNVSQIQSTTLFQTDNVSQIQSTTLSQTDNVSQIQSSNFSTSSSQNDSRIPELYSPDFFQLAYSIHMMRIKDFHFSVLLMEKQKFVKENIIMILNAKWTIQNQVGLRSR